MFGFEEVFQNHDLSLLFLRPPRHRVTCDLIPLAVLKPIGVGALPVEIVVTCDLIPLAVWKPTTAWAKTTITTLVTCDLIPPAVWKLLSLFGVVPAICCRMNLIPLAVWQRKREPSGSLFLCLSPRPASAALSCSANLLPML